MGRIAIVGGSPDYTGAPYYAGQSALKFGADLSFIFCAKQACNPIKSYSPELMVTSFYDQDIIISKYDSKTSEQYRRITIKKNEEEMSEKIIEYLPRIHSLVIGPGLGIYIYIYVYIYANIYIYIYTCIYIYRHP
jgi:ATP-dependent NAD(P)H-hydrate dehydratase